MFKIFRQLMVKFEEIVETTRNTDRLGGGIAAAATPRPAEPFAACHSVL
jgi:hypothetical protein